MDTDNKLQQAHNNREPEDIVNQKTETETEAENCLTYEQAYGRLEAIVSKLNNASIQLDEMVALYEEGMGLAEQCTKLLKSYDARLERVSKRSIMRELENAVGSNADDMDYETEV